MSTSPMYILYHTTLSLSFLLFGTNAIAQKTKLIKTIKESKFVLLEKYNKYKTGDSIGTKEVTFDTAGNVVSGHFFAPESTLPTKHKLCKYDKKGRLSKELYFELGGKEIYTYNTQGLLNKTTSYRSNGGFITLDITIMTKEET